MAVINVPRPPKKAYNPRRPPSALIQNQLTHLEWAVRPAGERKPGKFRVKPAKTEAEAAARIAKLTDQLRQQAAVSRKARRTAQPKPRRIAKRKSK